MNTPLAPPDVPPRRRSALVLATGAAAHLPACALFALLSAAWSLPLVANFATAIPGGGAGDNVCFVWNLWWMRTALQQHLNPFYTTYIFHPLGVDLTQHTHTALNGVVGATLLQSLSPIAAQNALLLVSLFLNAFVAYLLAHRLSGNRFAALAAGIVFGGAAPILIRLHGHFNLVGAWVIPLVVLTQLRVLDRHSVGRSVQAGLALAAAAYTDYYYLVYALVVCAICIVGRSFDVRVRFGPRRASRVSRALVVAIVLDLALIASIVLTGGFTLRLGGSLLTAQTTLNPRVALWFLLGLWALSSWRVSIAASVRRPSRFAADLRGLAVGAAVFALAALPLIAGTIRLLVSHEYTAPQYGWRSAPAGVDLGSLVLGNPLHLLYGRLTERAYAGLGINPMEGVAWIGLVAPLILIVETRRFRMLPSSRVWRIVAAVFGVWALGPYLNVLGFNLGAMLPGILLRYVPLVSNARIPGRAMVVVMLAVAMLVASALARLAAGWSARWKVAVVALLLLDVAPHPFPMYRPDSNSIYTRLRALPAGAVLEVPFGLRDGFGETGRLDHRTLLYQIVSGKPMLGGFVARIPERVKAWYREMPVVSELLRLSDPACPAGYAPRVLPVQEAYRALTAASVRYVVVNRRAATEGLMRYVSALPIERVAEDNDRELFVLRNP